MSKNNSESEEDRMNTVIHRINSILKVEEIDCRSQAGVLISLLLASKDDEDLKIIKNPSTFIGAINTRVYAILSLYGRGSFAHEIELKLPSATKNHKKYIKALLDINQALNNLDIKSLIHNGIDVLGRFYDFFLRTGTDAKGRGIVLTPSHIAYFAAKCIDIKYSDFVFDPTCGTGSFLISALAHVKQSSSKEQTNDFMKNHIYGIEKDPLLSCLGLVNMIFAGVFGKSINVGNAFECKFLKPQGDKFLSKILMNPPYCGREYKFVDNALSQTVKGGLLFAILPASTITSATDGRGEITWRKNLLRRHTVKAVMKLPVDLFLPFAFVGTYALIIEANIPHDFSKKTFFAFLKDGFRLKKSKRALVPGLPSNIGIIQKTVKEFIFFDKELETSERFLGFDKISARDETYDFAPETYLQAPIGACEDFKNFKIFGVGEFF